MQYISKGLKGEHPSQKEKFHITTEIPQFDSVSEFTTAVGGEAEHLKILNSYAANASAAPCRNFMGSKEAQSLDFPSVVKRVQHLRKHFDFSSTTTSGKLTGKDKVKLADHALGLAFDDSLSDEQKAAMILASIKAARAA